MTVPSLRSFRSMLSETRRTVNAELDDLWNEIQVAHEMAHDRRVGESAGKITTGGTSDPTANIVGDPFADRLAAHANLRRVLEQIPKRLAELEGAAAAPGKRVRGAMERFNPAETFTPLRFPRTASEADLAESRAAQQRRKETG